MTRLAVFISTVAYCGYFPIAPGTVGSLAGLVVYALVRPFGPAGEMTAIAVVALLGVWSGTVSERYFCCVDAGPIVIDEVLGMLITLFLVPVGWTGALTAFLLFRVSDVVKPYPSSRFERLPGGYGVMGDDAVAAVYANLALRMIGWLAPGWIE